MSPVFKWGLKGWLTKAEGGLVLQQLAIWLHVWASTTMPSCLSGVPRIPFSKLGELFWGEGAALLTQSPNNPGPSGSWYFAGSANQRPVIKTVPVPQARLQEAKTAETRRAQATSSEPARVQSLPHHLCLERDGQRDGRMDGERWMEGGNETGDSQSSGELPTEQRQSFE